MASYCVFVGGKPVHFTSSYTNKEAIQLLCYNVSNGNISNPFAASLVSYISNGKQLSEKQMSWVHKLVLDYDQKVIQRAEKVKLVNPITGRIVLVSYERTMEIFTKLNYDNIPDAWRQVRLKYISEGLPISTKKEKEDTNCQTIVDTIDLKVVKKVVMTNGNGHPLKFEYVISGSLDVCNNYIKMMCNSYPPSGYGTQFGQPKHLSDDKVIIYGHRFTSCD
jgi:hypothetical protein